ncbi:PhnD/SsuA/transferrin family substrate-binding protein [Microbulbifer sp. MKSA007]|nr:PhnD/SsuA/transferrin family substrate-binding protein [Microbulbifer sp. MKSA007]
MLKRLTVLILSLVILCGVPFVSSQENPKPFVFTAIPDQDPERLQKRFGKVAKYLSDALGVEVKYLPVKSYSDTVEAFKNNKVQLAWFGGFTGVQARIAEPGAKAIAQGEGDQNFTSYFIANKSTGLTPSKEFPVVV